MFKQYKVSDLIQELQRVLHREGDLNVYVNTLDCSNNEWAFSRPYIEMGIDDGGGLYLDGKYCPDCEKCEMGKKEEGV